jgi:hypothetical protein
MSALAAAQAARAEAAEKLEAAERAHARGRQAHEAAVAELARLDEAEKAWIARAASRLRSAAASGHQTVPELVADPKAAQARTSALVNERAAALALEQLAQDEEAASRELARADTAVAAEERAVRDAETEALAAQIEEHLAAVRRLGVELRRYQPDELHVPLNQLGRTYTSPRLKRVLEQLTLLERPPRGARVPDRGRCSGAWRLRTRRFWSDGSLRRTAQGQGRNACRAAPGIDRWASANASQRRTRPHGAHPRRASRRASCYNEGTGGRVAQCRGTNPVAVPRKERPPPIVAEPSDGPELEPLSPARQGALFLFCRERGQVSVRRLALAAGLPVPLVEARICGALARLLHRGYDLAFLCGKFSRNRRAARAGSKGAALRVGVRTDRRVRVACRHDASPRGRSAGRAGSDYRAPASRGAAGAARHSPARGTSRAEG